MAGTALFAIKGRANVIVGYNCPGPGLASTLKLGAPIRYERTGDLEVDLPALTAAIFSELERQIRATPEHWIYLPKMGELLADRLPVNATAQDEWMGKLDIATRQFASVLPEWPNIMDELRSLPLDTEASGEASSTIKPHTHPHTGDGQDSPTARRPLLL
jgi:KDO2-lipid IV(A) lauroyltransferase